jgi:hypothetical protein
MLDMGYKRSGSEGSFKECPDGCVMLSCYDCVGWECSGMIWVGNRGPKKAVDALVTKRLIMEAHS